MHSEEDMFLLRSSSFHLFPLCLLSLFSFLLKIFSSPLVLPFGGVVWFCAVAIVQGGGRALFCSSCGVCVCVSVCVCAGDAHATSTHGLVAMTSAQCSLLVVWGT